MTPLGVPDSVLQCIADKIDSVPHLEALLLLWENGGRSWPIDEIAARIYVNTEAAATILQSLQRHHLVSVETGPVPRYRYSPVWDTDGMMEQVAAAYRHHLVPIATFIHAHASSSVREFARAFDLKKDR